MTVIAVENISKENIKSIKLSIFSFKVRCLKNEFPVRSFPGVAGELFERESTFRAFNISLEQTVTGYNRLRTQTALVEYNLISGELGEIDELLDKAENSLNWNADGMLPYLYPKNTAT